MLGNVTTAGFLLLQVTTVHIYRTRLRNVTWLHTRPVCQRPGLQCVLLVVGASHGHLLHEIQSRTSILFRPRPDSSGFQLPMCQLQTMGEWGKRDGELSLKRADTASYLNETQYQGEMEDASSILGKCNRLNWPNFRLKPMDTQLAFFW